MAPNPVFTKLVAHLKWADEAVIQALRHAPPRKESIDLLAHVLGAEHVWLARLTQAMPSVAVWPTLTLDECADLAAGNHSGWQTLIEGLRAEDYSQLVHYRNSAGQEFDSTVEDILLHVCLHGSYHRGQISRAIREGGSAPIPTDYIGYIRGVPAATRQR